MRKERDELARQLDSLRMNADRLKMSEAHAEEISKQLATVKKERDDFARQLSEGFKVGGELRLRYQTYFICISSFNHGAWKARPQP